MQRKLYYNDLIVNTFSIPIQSTAQYKDGDLDVSKSGYIAIGVIGFSTNNTYVFPCYLCIYKPNILHYVFRTAGSSSLDSSSLVSNVQILYRENH